MAAGVRGDADEICSQRGIIGLRPVRVHPNRDQANNSRGGHDGQAKSFPDDFAIEPGQKILCVSHKFSP
jgi:hypothetical protein